MKAGSGEYVPLGDLIQNFHEGALITKKDVSNNPGTHPCVVYYELYKYGCRIDKPKTYINKEAIPKQRFCKYGDLLLCNAAFDISRMCKASVYLYDLPALVSEHIWVFKHNQDPVYLAYAWSTNHVNKQILKLEKPGVSAMHISIDEIKKVTVPILSPEKQNLIVEKLNLIWEGLDPDVRELIHDHPNHSEASIS